MTCPRCRAANREGRKFCAECGAALALSCSTCGAANEPGERFCGECGAALAAQPRDVGSPSPQPAAERRLVSVLFADLVGFTTLSENRDAEDVRELLSRYFDSCRRLIELYGGTVEKFIGDAVMAVWGTPAAQEDDAERAVRTALDLVAAVPELASTLRARAAVLTGEAAVTLGAEGQGMVAGDLVNTASRIQSIAEPGTVLVGETTRRATEAAIAYESAGEHELKGKAEPVPLYRAVRVIAARRGALKGQGLEPPFVGRGRELRLVKELFHASADEGKAHLVSVSGVAGNGKSRLAWELEKYLDGLAIDIYWHRGRCLAYGEGVAYWALAEMVRTRAKIAEGDTPDAARAKVREAVEEHVADAEERTWVGSRLAQLLGLEERQAHEREDLFAGWRLFFERMAESQPVVMVFDDMQWADTSLLEFVEYLLEWSRNHPIFVLTLARPELVEHHPQWGAGKRNFTSLALEPLPVEAMKALLFGFVPGLPEGLLRQILDRAEGVPLYAVETVRMLLDRGLLEREGGIYRPTGPIEALDVPETLHALVAARLDGLEPAERRLLQDASVLGKSFTKAGLSALSGLGADELEPLLGSLARKEVLSIQVDPRSPDRGQYVFLQDLLKHVAYETLAKRERKVRHLAAAAHLGRLPGTAEHELVEIVAAHYRDAYASAPDDPDASEIKAKALETLARAGERAASLAAAEEAQRYFEQAAELADDPALRAQLHERAGETASVAGGRAAEAQAHYERAIELFQAAGGTHPAARVSARLAELEWLQGHLDQAVERMERAYAVLAGDEPDADFAALTSQLGRLQFFAGNLERASELLEAAVGLAEAQALPEVLAQTLNTYGVISTWRGRGEMAQALYVHSLKLALEHDLPTPALRAYNNLGDASGQRDRYEETLEYDASGIALARKVGNRTWEWRLLLESCYPLMQLGRWDEALARAAELPEGELERSPLYVPMLAEIHACRGDVAEARRLLETARTEDSADLQERTNVLAGHALVLLAERRAGEALAAAKGAIETRSMLSARHQAIKSAFVTGLDAAVALGRRDEAEKLLAEIDGLQPGELSSFLAAQRARVRGALGGGEQPFKTAAALFREYGLVFWLAVNLLQHGEWLLGEGRADEAEPLLAEARETFERLEAAAWLERLETVATAGVPA